MKLHFGYKNKLYPKIFLFFLISVVTIIFITSAILYFNFENIALNIVYSDTMSSLEQASKNVAIMAQTGTTLINQMFRDFTITKLLYFNEPDVYEIQAALSQLQSYSQVMHFINSIYVYNENLNTMYIASKGQKNNIQNKDAFEDENILHIIDNYQNYLSFSPIPRSFSLGDENINCYTFLGYNWLDSGETLKNAIIVNISQEWINSVISPNQPDGGSPGDSFIIDRNGLVISKSKYFSMMEDISGEKYMQNILKADINDYLISPVNGVESFIAYTSSDYLGWRYIRIIPYNHITKDISRMKTYTVIFSLVILLAGLIFSFILSKILYKPIKKIEVDLDLLQKEKRNTKHTLRQDFLRNIVLDNTKYKANELLSKFKEYNPAIADSGKYFLIILKIDSYLDFLKNYTSADRNLLKFAIMNVSAELCTEAYNTESIDMNDDDIVLVLNSIDDKPAESVETDLEYMAGSIQDNVLKHLGISLTVIISPPGENLIQLNELYKQAKKASLHRLFSGHKSIILSKEILSYESKDYLYPVKKEQMFQDALMKGNIDEAKEIYLEIISESAELPYSVINFVISRLALTLNVTLNTIQRNNSIDTDSTSQLLFFQMNEVETIQGVHQSFFKFIDSISVLLDEKKNLKHEILVDKINGIIKSRYMDPGLGVDNIADSLMMSSNYIGKIYKQITLKTINESIIEKRMLEARRLLAETDVPILSVAELTGFSSDSYFYKTFKKKNGITPADYRKNS